MFGLLSDTRSYLVETCHDTNVVSFHSIIPKFVERDNS
jgi:hypothetical protein